MSTATEQLKKSETTRSWWRFGTTGWVLILGLIVLNIGVLFESVEWNKRTIGWLIYRIDPRYWPLWPVPVLWGIVVWMLNDTLKSRIGWIAKEQTRIKSGIILVFLCWTAWLAGWTFAMIRKRIYYRFYEGCIIGPISSYLVDGTTSWKLLIPPILAIATISVLLYIAYRQRKKNHESKSGIEKSGPTAE